MPNSSTHVELDERVNWIGSKIVRTRTILPKQWIMREKGSPPVENSRHFQVIPRGSGGSYCQGETANFGQDTNIDPLAETVTEPVVLFVTTATLSSDNCNAVPRVITPDPDTSSRNITRKHKSKVD